MFHFINTWGQYRLLAVTWLFSSCISFVWKKWLCTATDKRKMKCVNTTICLRCSQLESIFQPLLLFVFMYSWILGAAKINNYQSTNALQEINDMLCCCVPIIIRHSLFFLSFFLYSYSHSFVPQVNWWQCNFPLDTT